MELGEFIHHVRVLNNASCMATELLEILKVSNGCDNFIDHLGIEYGELVLKIVSGKTEIPDGLYEEFWNDLIYDDNISDEEIKEFYQKLQ